MQIEEQHLFPLHCNSAAKTCKHLDLKFCIVKERLTGSAHINILIEI